MSSAQSVDLYDFLNGIGLISYLQPMRLQLGVETFEQLKYVKKDDLQGIGMPPPIRRQFLEEYRKKAGYTKIPLINKRVKVRPPSLKGFNGTKTESGMLHEGPRNFRSSCMPGDNPTIPSDERADTQLCSTNEQPFVIGDNNLTILEHIGQGHFATVYKATLRLNNAETTVAVKELKPGSTSGPFKDLTKEARVMMAVRHKNIIHFYGIVLGDVGRSPYNATIRLVFEYANGGSLDSYLKNKKPRLTIHLQWLYCQQILSGLAFLHERRLLHRDIAARNILVFNQELVKLADFGLSKLLPDVDESYTAETAIMPVAWSAPESLKFKRYSAYSDVYMFGVTCWEIFSFGDHPYPRLTANEMLSKLENGQTLTSPNHCPDNVYSLLLTCCSMMAADRPDTQSLVCQWRQVSPKMETTVSSCSVYGKLNFEKGDQLYVISTRTDESGGLIVKAQNKRTYAVGETHSSNLANKCSNSASKMAPMPFSGGTSDKNVDAKSSTPVSKEKDASVSAAKAVLMHVPQRNLSPDEPSAWDYELYGEDSNSAHSKRSTLVSESRTKSNSTSLEHTGDLIDLSSLKPKAEHFSPDTGSPDVFERLVNNGNNFGATGADTESGDNCSIYDEQSEFYSVVDSDEDRRTPTDSCQINNYNPFADMTSTPNSANCFTNQDNTLYNNATSTSSSTFWPKGRALPNYECSQSNWAPISVQENSDSHFDKLPNVQYSVYSGSGGAYSSARQKEEFKRQVSRSFEIVKHSEVLNHQSCMTSETKLGPDLIDLNTLKVWDSETKANNLEGRQTSSKHPLVKGMEMGGSRFSVDLESVLSDKSRKADSASEQTDFIDEMEQRIKKLREVQLSSSFRSKKLTEQKPAVQLESAIKPKPQSAQANSNATNVQLSSLSRSVDISTANFDPLNSMSSSGYNTSATTTANVFTCSTVGRRKGDQSTFTASRNVQGAAGCQKSLPRNSTSRTEGAAERVQLSVRKTDAIIPPNFSASKPGCVENLPTAPPYEMLSNNTLKFLGDPSNITVEKLCSKVKVATTEQCYNALVEASWNEQQAEELLKVQILQNMCSLTACNCKLILSNFKYDLTKASRFVHELEKNNSTAGATPE